MREIFTLTHLFLLSLIVINAHAQLDKSATLDLVDDRLDKYNGLFSGTNYEYSLINQSNPFFKDESWSDAIIKFNGNTYVGVPAIYDINQDLVVIKIRRDDLVYPIALNSYLLESFEILGDRFIKLQGEAERTFLHEIFIGDKISYLKKYEKRRGFSNSLQKVIYETSVSDYIYFDGQLLILHRKSKLGKLNQKLRDGVKAFVSSHGKLNLQDEKNFLLLLKNLDSEL